MEELAKRLTNLRESKGWTKTYVANKLGIKTLSTYANYEYGLREPDMETLSRIADIYEVTVDYLLGRTSVKNNSMVLGKEIDINTLPDRDRMLLEWARSKPSLGLIENKGELSNLIKTLDFHYELEQSKKNKN